MLIKTVLLLVSVIALACLPCRAMAEPIFRVSHDRTPGSAADNDIHALTHEISRSTNIRFEIYPAGALGGYNVVQQKLSDGLVEMALEPGSSTQDSRFNIGNLPYLVYDWKEARNKFGKNGVVRKAMEALFEQHGIRVLAVYPQYFGGISLQKNPLATDRAAIRVRVPKTAPFFAETWGFKPIDLAFTEINSAFKSGLIDGVAGSGAEGCYVSFLEYTKYYFAANTHFEVWYLLVNKNRYDSLPSAYKDAFGEAAAYFEALRWSRAEGLQAFNELRLRDSNVIIIRPTQQELEKMAWAVRRSVWPPIVDQIGKTYAESILGAME